MPRKPIAYSNTIIYKLCCNDPNITEVYVGHTTNWTNRKNEHKSNCNNENSKKYNLQVYTFIRDHGNWDNWSMIQIEKICCVDELDAKKNERRHIELLGATLNSIMPSRTPQECCKIYRENNAEKIKEKDKIWYKENKEKKKEYRIKYRENNVEKIRELKKNYRENNVEKINEQCRKYYQIQKQIKLETERLFDIDI